METIRIHMKAIIACLLIVLIASSAFALPGGTVYSYPTKIETLLRRTGMVISSTSQPVGATQGVLRDSETNVLNVSVRTIVVSDAKTRELGVAVQMRVTNDWRSPITYIDYDELDGLTVGINKTLALQPDLPVVRAKYETRGGLMVGTYSTEKREVLGWLEINQDESNQVKLTPDALRELRDFLITAKKNLDLIKSGQ